MIFAGFIQYLIEAKYIKPDGIVQDWGLLRLLVLGWANNPRWHETGDNREAPGFPPHGA